MPGCVVSVDGVVEGTAVPCSDDGDRLDGSPAHAPPRLRGVASMKISRHPPARGVSIRQPPSAQLWSESLGLEAVIC